MDICLSILAVILVIIVLAIFLIYRGKLNTVTKKTQKEKIDSSRAHDITQFNVDFVNNYSNYPITGGKKSGKTKYKGGSNKLDQSMPDPENIKVNNVIPLTNSEMRYIKLEDYVWMEKTDGERVLYSNAGNILDCEEYDGKLYCFDALFVNGEDIRMKNFIDRMKIAKQQFGKSNKLKGGKIKYIDNIEKNIITGGHICTGDREIIIKEYYSIETIDKLITFVNENDCFPGTNRHIDGIILQEITKSYNSSHNFKLKRICMNTIDFFTVKCTEEILNSLDIKIDNNSPLYLLYSGGSYINNSILQSKVPQQSNKSLFVAPYYEKAYLFRVQKLSENDRKLYPKYIADEIDSLTEEIIKNPDIINNTVVELSFSGNISELGSSSSGNSSGGGILIYYPIRIRKDKLYPNGYRTAISNISLIYAPLETGEKYFEDVNNNGFSNDTKNKFHGNSHAVRKEIFNKLPVLPEKVKRGSCLDLSCGRGADLKPLLDKNYRNLFGVDIDKNALSDMVSRLYMSDLYKHNWINIFNYDLSGKLDDLYNNIISRKEYSLIYCFHLVLMNFAIHYIIENINELQSFVKKLLMQGGHFAFTFFDGDKILKEMKTIEDKDFIGSATFGEFEIKVSKKNNRYYGTFPLPTISSTGYREEPLVLREELAVLGDRFTEYNNLIDDPYFSLICLRIYKY